ncbi:unnamed protein product [Fraxinus pennsylvanica]|uniref:Uncharacterized protein n=1 Tax=Fraxinus pennsylvanica TaxID=56036 RepID=A0AAD2EH28_9LAMI|nr:unnamed protein product [Fraxinus pennsylvanica]
MKPSSIGTNLQPATIRLPWLGSFGRELSDADDRASWIFRPLNSNNLTELRREKEHPVTGAKEADWRAEARGTVKVSNIPAMDKKSKFLGQRDFAYGYLGV